MLIRRADLIYVINSQVEFTINGVVRSRFRQALNHLLLGLQTDHRRLVFSCTSKFINNSKGRHQLSHTDITDNGLACSTTTRGSHACHPSALDR